MELAGIIVVVKILGSVLRVNTCQYTRRPGHFS